MEAVSSALSLAPAPLREVRRLSNRPVQLREATGNEPPSERQPSVQPPETTSRASVHTAKVDANVTRDDSATTTTPAQRQPDELVVRAQRGDTEAFTALFRRHRSAVTAIAYRMLGPSADLEDVVQDVFLQVHRSLPDFRSQAKFSTWLHRVAVNVVLMTRRRAKSRPVYMFEETPRQEADIGPLPDQRLDKLRRQRAFHRLLDKLSDKKRTVFVLHELEGMLPSEIAKHVGCPVLTVRTRLFYARRELTELMKREPALAPLLNGQSLTDEAPESAAFDSSDGRPRASQPVASTSKQRAAAGRPTSRATSEHDEDDQPIAGVRQEGESS